MVFDDESSTVPFMREGKIPPNWIDLVYHSSQNYAPDNIDTKYNWFTPDLEEYPSETPSHEPSVAPENNNNTITSSQSAPHVQESPASEGAHVSEVIKLLASEGVLNTSNWNKVHFDQKLLNSPSVVPSSEG